MNLGEANLEFQKDADKFLSAAKGWVATTSNSGQRVGQPRFSSVKLADLSQQSRLRPGCGVLMKVYQNPIQQQFYEAYQQTEEYKRMLEKNPSDELLPCMELPREYDPVLSYVGEQGGSSLD